MLIIFAIIIFLLLFFKSISGGRISYVNITFGNGKSKKYEPYIRFLHMSEKFSWDDLKVINASIYNIGVEPFFKKMDVILKDPGLKDYYVGKERNAENPEEKFNEFTGKLKKNINAKISYELNFSDSPDKNATYSIPLIKIGCRDSYGFKYSHENFVETGIKYYIIDTVMRGDQWTMIDEKTMTAYKNNGFKVECFASPFNARLKFFGSIFKSDEPFGRIGTCFDIFDQLIKTGELKWRDEIIIGKTEIVRLIISPPSSYELIYRVLKYVRTLYEKRKCIIHIGIPAEIQKTILEKKSVVADMLAILEQSKTQNFRELYDAYSFIEGVHKKVSVPWYHYLVQNF